MNFTREDSNSGVFHRDSQALSSEDGMSTISELRRDCPSCNMNLPFSVRVCPNDGTDLFLASNVLFAEKYQLVEEIGRGAIGTIYKAKHLALDTFVAIKVLSQVTGDKTTFLRFQREAKAASRITHPNVISVFDFGVWQECQPYMVMDYLEGNTLDKILRKNGRLPIDEILEIMHPVADALSHAHGKGILHRDLKPSNIMIMHDGEASGRVKLLDFGLAKLLFKDDGISLSATGTVQGSPAYMSPEQATGSKVDGRADLYALGCMLYEMLTGDPPLLGDSAAETFMQRLNHDPLPVSSVVNYYVPEKLDVLVSRLLERDPNKRCKSAAWVYKELVAIKLSIEGMSPERFLQSGVEMTSAFDNQIPVLETTEQEAVRAVKDEIDIVSSKPADSKSKFYIDLSFIPELHLVEHFNKLPIFIKMALVLSLVFILALVARIVLQ